MTCNLVGAYIRWNFSLRKKDLNHFLETHQEIKNMIVGVFFWIGTLLIIARFTWPEKF